MDDGTVVRSTTSSHGPIFELRFNSLGKFLLTGSANGSFEVIDCRTWQPVFTVPPTTDPLWEAELVLPCMTWLEDENAAIVSPEQFGHRVNCWQFGAVFSRSPTSQLPGHEKPIHD